MPGVDEPLRVADPYEGRIAPGPLLRILNPEQPTDADVAALRGLHAWVSGLLPPPSWAADDILDSLEREAEYRVLPGHYMGLSVEPDRSGQLVYGVWPEPA